MINPRMALDVCWSALGIYWLYSALETKKTAVNEKSRLRILRLSILALTLLLLLSDWLRIGPLRLRLIPDIAAVVWFGVALTAAGVALAIWARWNLGQNWSDKVVLKVGHELIRTGPYAYLRHPIYTGVLLAVAGTGLAIGEIRGLAALILLGTNYYVKAVREERILAANFGDQFLQYKRTTGFLFPGI